MHKGGVSLHALIAQCHPCSVTVPPDTCGAAFPGDELFQRERGLLGWYGMSRNAPSCGEGLHH